MPVYDLRSDTVTRPTAAMRTAMAEAAVGDDAYGDDPTVCALQARVAELLGKPAAVFLPSGTMANQIAVRVHGAPGQALAAPPRAHVQIHEDGSAAGLSGVQIMPIGNMGGYTLDDLQALCAEETCGWPEVALVWLENTLGAAGGAIWPIEQLEAIGTWARAQGRAVHLDGARLWHAHVATGIALQRYGAVADTVSVALSKGLGAPMGSVLCGSEATIERARHLKHALGGGFRQAGIVAAAGLFALDHHLQRLADDHRRARTLAQAVSNLPCWRVDPPATNMVIAHVQPPHTAAESLCAPLREAGVLCYPNVFREVRLAVHQGIDDDALGEVIAIIRRTLGREPG